MTAKRSHLSTWVDRSLFIGLVFMSSVWMSVREVVDLKINKIIKGTEGTVNYYNDIQQYNN